MKKSLVFILLIFSLTLVSCTLPENEVTDSLVGEASKDEISKCYQDKVCKEKFTQCYNKNCIKLEKGSKEWNNCVDGCLGEEESPLMRPIEREECIDSDGGKNFEEQGTVKVEGEKVIFTDKCVNNTGLMEYFCEKDKYGRITEECESGCREGACVEDNEARGSDTEGRLEVDLHEFYNCQGFELTCIDENLWCVRDGSSSLVSLCRNGCQDGRCINRTIEPLTGSCTEVIRNHNNIKEDRINIVFVGVGYDNPEFFGFLVDSVIDYDSNYYGFLSIEPFDSNRDKFNFWYLDEIQNNNLFYGEEVYLYGEFNEIIRRLPLPCNYPNQQIVVLHEGSHGKAWPEIAYIGISDLNISLGQFPDCSESDLNEDGCTDNSDLSIVQSNSLEIDGFNECLEASYGCDFSSIPSDNRVFYYKRKFAPVLHEFAHSFGLLADEYNIYGVVDFELSNGSGGNCYVALSEAECIANSPWNDLIGRGCGDESTIDCDSSDEEYTLEIGCFEGCGAPTGVYRPAPFSMMGTKDPANGYNRYNPHYSFRLVNERIFCNRIKEMTGSASGYCTTEFGIS